MESDKIMKSNTSDEWSNEQQDSNQVCLTKQNNTKYMKNQPSTDYMAHNAVDISQDMITQAQSPLGTPNPTGRVKGWGSFGRSS